ncbi:MAG: hypothetical protein HP002_08540 [Lentisphaeria bacterium]|nr:hypothetical protein [Lentisphaeria bacterium]
MKLDTTIFHKFFYAGEDESCIAKSATSFSGWTFKSYNTTIGIKTPGKDGRPVLLIADSSFSNTTSAHLSALRAACPYTSSHIIRVPFEWGDGWYKRENCISDLLQRFIDRLSQWRVDQLKYAESRRDFVRMYHNFLAFIGLVAKRPAKKVLQKIEEMAVIADETEDRKKRNDLISGLTAKREAAAKRKAAAEKRKCAALLEPVRDLPYLAKIRVAYWTSFRPDISHDIRSALRTVLNPLNNLSFVVPENEERVVTSQGVYMDCHTVRIALKAWKAERIHAGQHIGPYTLREMTAGYVQLGCHKIPMQNIRELYSALVEGAAE